jgi:hypothetical protein
MYHLATLPGKKQNRGSAFKREDIDPFSHTFTAYVHINVKVS